ncbi:MAG: MATE family efflux transporter [Bacillota bacterium]|nr:MATE family efflux transporter [Bacillota bacterium]
MNNDQQKLATAPVRGLLFKLALPAITAQIVNVLYNMVDRMFIGHIEGAGAEALTGVGVAMPVVVAMTAFAALAGMGGAPRAAIMMGRKKHHEAEKILGNCFSLLIITAVILTAVVRVFGKQILMVFGASSNTIGYALDYLDIYCLGTVFVLLAIGLNSFISTQGYAGMSMLTVVIGAVINTVLDPVFIFVLGMGVRGAALVTVFSQGISALWVLKFLTSRKPAVKIRLRNMRIDPRILLPCVALGLSPFVMQFTESVIIVCFNISLLKYGGDLAVGAMTILTTVMQFAMLPIQGFTQGAQPIISYNYGAGNYDRIRKAFKLTLKCSLVYSTVMWAVCMFLPQFFIQAFTPHQELVDYSVWAIRIYMAAMLLFGIQISCQQTFVAIGNAKTSVFLALLRKVILLIPLIFIMPMLLEDKAFAVFLAEPVADFCAVMTTGILFSKTYRKLKSEEKV